MKITSSKTGTRRYCIAKLGRKEQFNPREMEILYSGAVPSLIAPDTVQGHKNNILQFNISPYSTLEFHLTCILSREQFADLLLQCITVFRQMQQLHLSFRNLVLNPTQVYVQLQDRSIHFIYLPLLDARGGGPISDFFRTLVQRASRSTYEQVSFLDACLDWINRPAPFTLEEFEGFVRRNTAAEQAPSQTRQPSPQSETRPTPWNSFHDPSDRTPETDNTVRIVGGGNGGTILLSHREISAPNMRYFLHRIKDDERREIKVSPFVVGTEVGEMGYLVTGNPAISRNHAKIILRDGDCFIIDCKSTNKTYVNDIELEAFQERRLEHGDTIRLANEDFRFEREG